MIFISHAWRENQPDERVLSFVDMLRKKGYEAECDVMYQQKSTAIHFDEMMASALRCAEKTVIILSENYKEKADGFKGGVGSEYRYIINDFNTNPNKYILVSFNGRSNDIIPDFLRGRDIVDLYKDEKEDYRELFSKLASVDKYVFASVAPQREIPLPKEIASYNKSTNESRSKKLGISVQMKKEITDIDRKKFMKESYERLIGFLDELSCEFCNINHQYLIENEEIDSRTRVYEIYKNDNRESCIQIWLGSMVGNSLEVIGINNHSGNIGQKNSYNEVIMINETEGQLSLNFMMNRLNIQNGNEGTIEAVTKIVWERFFVKGF